MGVLLLVPYMLHCIEWDLNLEEVDCRQGKVTTVEVSYTKFQMYTPLCLLCMLHCLPQLQ